MEAPLLIGLDEQQLRNRRAPRVCALCGATSDLAHLRRCNGCGLVRYCSVEHQTEHWPEHRAACKAASAAAGSGIEKTAPDAANVSAQEQGGVSSAVGTPPSYGDDAEGLGTSTEHGAPGDAHAPDIDTCSDAAITSDSDGAANTLDATAIVPFSPPASPPAAARSLHSLAAAAGFRIVTHIVISPPPSRFVTWPDLVRIFPLPATGRTMLLRLVSEPRPQSRWAVSAMDSEGNIAFLTFAVYPDRSGRPPLPGLRCGALLQWDNPRACAFMGGFFGGRIEDEDLPDVTVVEGNSGGFGRGARRQAQSRRKGGRGKKADGKSGAGEAKPDRQVAAAAHAAAAAPAQRPAERRPPPVRHVAAPIRQEWSVERFVEKMVPVVLLMLGLLALGWVCST